MSETETGFLANGIVNILDKSKDVTEDEEYVLKKALKFINYSFDGMT
jgi:hypothetical protein